MQAAQDEADFAVQVVRCSQQVAACGLTWERKAALPMSNRVGVSALARDIISAALSAEMHSTRRVHRLQTLTNQVL